MKATKKQIELLDKLLSVWGEINDEADNDPNFENTLYDLDGHFDFFNKQREGYQAQLSFAVQHLMHQNPFVSGFQLVGRPESNSDLAYCWMHPDEAQDEVVVGKLHSYLFPYSKDENEVFGMYMFRQYRDGDIYDLTSYDVYFKPLDDIEPIVDIVPSEDYAPCPCCSTRVTQTELEKNEGYCADCIEDDYHYVHCAECGDLKHIDELDDGGYCDGCIDKAETTNVTYDVEFQIVDINIWVRVNDIIADDEDDAVAIAYGKLEDETGIVLSNFKEWYANIVNTESHE